MQHRSFRHTSFLMFVAVAALTLPNLAQAHPGHDVNGFVAGALHPLTGLDHVLAMVAIGIWAAQQQRARQIWLMPATFMAALLIGGAIGATGAFAMPGVEFGIALSVLVVGCLIAVAAKVPAAYSLPLVAFFALCHGFAHGAEMPANGSGLLFGIGALLATAALHVAGIAIAKSASLKPALPALRVVGAAIAAAGVYLVAF